MNTRRSNQSRIFLSFLFFSSVLLLLLVQCTYRQCNVGSRFITVQGQPSPAQVTPPSISCDVANGASFPGEGLKSINWTISGFIYYQYLLKDNGIVTDFGTIASNDSEIVRQLITPINGWHAFSIHIRNQTHILSETYVVFEIIVDTPLWLEPGFWLTIIASIASVSVVSNVVLWRKMKRAEPSGRNAAFFPDDQKPMAQRNPINISSFLTADVIPTKNQIEERWFTFISTTRVAKVWLFNSSLLQFILTKLIRRELWEENRESTLDQALNKYLSDSNSALPRIGVPNFAVIRGMREREHLLWIRFGETIILALLLRGRITHTYLKWVIRVCEELGVMRQAKKEISPEHFLETLEVHLKISRSFSHIEAAEETNRILRASDVPGLFDDSKIHEDARGLTPSECVWVLHKSRELQDIAPSDSILDEVEDLS